MMAAVEPREHVADGSLHVTVPESAQGFFCPRHDGQLRCHVLEKFPPEPSRYEARDVEDRLQLLVGEGERGHGPGRLDQPPHQARLSDPECFHLRGERLAVIDDVMCAKLLYPSFRLGTGRRRDHRQLCNFPGELDGN